ncbi:hypothetical protein [Actinobacillus porcinus]|nr:hypothetical protein [Actinobacillus porcinus]MDY6215000.1 hypothetical protein [Actinobacillus porcinus]
MNKNTITKLAVLLLGLTLNMNIHAYNVEKTLVFIDNGRQVNP